MLTPKLQLIEFLKHVREQNAHKEAPDNCEFTFELEGSLAFADAYVHRMRVALTNFRRRIRNQRRQLNPFSVLVKNREINGNTIKVTIEYAETVSPLIQRQLSEIFDVLAVPDATTMDHKEVRGLAPPPTTITLNSLNKLIADKFNVKTS